MLAALLLAATIAPTPPGLAESTIQVAPFGDVHLIEPTRKPPARTIVFVSGDGGWNRGVVDIARKVALSGALIAGVDFPAYQKELRERSDDACGDAAADFAALTSAVQARLQPSLVSSSPDVPAASPPPPVLVGYSSGATFVYALLEQMSDPASVGLRPPVGLDAGGAPAPRSPAGSWSGAISLGFCPDLEPPTPMCGAPSVGYREGKLVGNWFLPDVSLDTPWVAFVGDQDQVCNADDQRRFVAEVPGSDLVVLPRVGHGFADWNKWIRQFLAVYRRMVGLNYLGRSLDGEETRGGARLPEMRPWDAWREPAQEDELRDSGASLKPLP